MPTKPLDLSNMSLASDSAKMNEERRLLTHEDFDNAIVTRPYSPIHPAPDSRRNLSQQTFADLLNNQNLLAEAQKKSFDIHTVSGQSIGVGVQGLSEWVDCGDEASSGFVKQTLSPGKPTDFYLKIDSPSSYSCRRGESKNHLRSHTFEPRAGN